MNVKHLLLSCATLTGMLVTSCTNDELISVNSDPVGNAITFSPSVGRTTRATETTLKNLGDFAVYARSVDHKGSLYANFIIGNADDKSPEIAKKANLNVSGTEGFWNLSRKVYWPTGVQRVLFWALTTLQNGDTYTDTDVLGDNGKLTFGDAGPEITGFSPIRAERENTSYMDGTNQHDLVGAFTPQQASESQSNVPLNFKHELSQIKILAKVGDGQPDNSRRVTIKGAWIVNASSKGDFKANYDWNGGNPKDSPKWENLTSKVAYGSLFETPKKLDSESSKDAVDILSTASGTGSLMLIPQTVEAWNKNNAGTDGPRQEYNACETTDAYILLYCRIESVHKGSSHEGDDNIGTGTDEHYHQLFPVGNYDETKYGYTCVPVKIEWLPGKRYTYTLNICGANSGGGVYPPVLPPDVPEDPKPVPDDKKPGDPVLDSEISFTVTVEGWTDDETWKPGGNDLNFN